MTLQYEQTNINLERVTASKSFIFDSNATEGSDIVFNSWSSMLNVLQGIPGIKEIIIRSEAGSPAVIPPGTYDMTDIVLRGANCSVVANINNAVFQNLVQIEDLLMQVGGSAANTVANFQINNAAGEILCLDRASFVVGPLATAPIFEIIAGGLTISATYSSFQSINPAVPVFDVQNVSVLAFNLFSQTGGQNNYGGPLGSESIFTIAGGATVTLPINATDTFFAQDQTSVPTVSFVDNYEAAVVADWSGIEPESIQNALDRLAAAVGPVP